MQHFIQITSLPLKRRKERRLRPGMTHYRAAAKLRFLPYWSRLRRKIPTFADRSTVWRRPLRFGGMESARTRKINRQNFTARVKTKWRNILHQFWLNCFSFGRFGDILAHEILAREKQTNQTFGPFWIFIWENCYNLDTSKFRAFCLWKIILWYGSAIVHETALAFVALRL